MSSLLRIITQTKDDVGLDQRGGSRKQIPVDSLVRFLRMRIKEVSRVSPKCMNRWAHEVPFVV